MGKKDDRIKVIHKTNGGLSDARNAGLDVATGDYISFIDSDDTIEVDYYENLIKIYENNKNLDLIIGALNITGFQNRFIWFNKEGIISKNMFHDFIKEPNFFGLFASPCNKLYKKANIKQLFLIETSNGEDAIFNFEYLKNCKNIYLTNKIYYNYYYENENSLTKSFSEERFNNLLFMNKKFNQFLKDFNCESDKISNRLLLRDVCSITKSLGKSKEYNKNQKIKIIKKMLNNEQVKNATKKYISYGLQEKLAFKLIKYKLANLFYICCNLKKKE